MEQETGPVQRGRTPITPAGTIGTKSAGLNGPRDASKSRRVKTGFDVAVDLEDKGKVIRDQGSASAGPRILKNLNPIIVPDAVESELSKRNKEVVRGARVGVHKLDHLVESMHQSSEERLEKRDWNIDERARIEDVRTQALRSNTETQEQLLLEVDTKLAQQQAHRAARLYAKTQIELGLPDWFGTLRSIVEVMQAEGHSEKLRWRSSVCALMKRCILESQDDEYAADSREQMKKLVLCINQYRAADLIGHCARIKDSYIDLCKSNANQFGQASQLLQDSEAAIDTTSIVPLERTDWSAKLDEADLSRQSLALHSTESWSTLSRPSTLSGGDLSSFFSGDPKKLMVKTIIDGYGTKAKQTGMIPGTGPPAPVSLPQPVIKGVPDSQKKGALKGGNYQVHPACMNAEQSQGIKRMRSAAAMGNFELTRSLFYKNFDSAKRVRAYVDSGGYKKLSVGKLPPTLEVFRILMMAFKNADDIRFENAFEVIDIVESYGFSPDTAMYNVMMRACEKESRWRRAIAMYRDLINVHHLLPNVQTFDIIIDCCRHSLEDPAVIYECLRAEKLPHDFCYKAAVCNCGNRIPLQVMQETMYDVEAEGVPKDGRFERQVEKEREMRASTQKSGNKAGAKNAQNLSRNDDEMSVVTIDTVLQGSVAGGDTHAVEHESKSHHEDSMARKETDPYVTGGTGVRSAVNLNVYTTQSVVAADSDYIENALEKASLEDKKKAYKWEKFHQAMKQRLPAKSPVVTGAFGKPNKPFNTQLSRNLPEEAALYLDAHQRTHYPPPKTEPNQPGGGVAKEGVVVGGDHSIMYTGSLNHQRSVSFEQLNDQSSAQSSHTGNISRSIRDDKDMHSTTSGQSPKAKPVGLVQPSWISSVDVGSPHHSNPHHHNYVASAANSVNTLNKHSYIQASASDLWVDPYMDGADIIAPGGVGSGSQHDDVGTTHTTTKASAITYSEMDSNNSSALDRWRERKEILEHEAMLLEQASTPINPKATFFDEAYVGKSTPSPHGHGAQSVGSSTVVFSSPEDTLSKSLKRLNMNEDGSKMKIKTQTRPSAYGYNATIANKEHREKKKAEWEAAEQQKRDVENYEAHLEKKRREELYAAGLSPNTATVSAATKASQASPDASQGTEPGGSLACDESTLVSKGSNSFKFARMLDEVEKERKQQDEQLQAAREFAFRKDISRLPKFKARTNQPRQKPLVKVQSSNRIMAAVASQMVLGGNVVQSVKFRSKGPV